MTVTTLPRSPAGGRTLALIVALMALPFILGGGLYFLGWKPEGGGAHGELLSPRPLPASGLSTPDGKPLPTREVAGKWLLVLAGSGPCDAACAGRIDEMRRVHVSLYKEMGRLKRLVLTTVPADPALTAARAAQPDLTVAAMGDDWPALFPGEGYRLHVVDPQGNLMLRYSPDAPTKGIRSDLERLLKYAWTG